MAQKWSKMIQLPKICMKSSYLINYYPHSPPPPLIQAMPERKRFFFIDVFPYWKLKLNQDQNGQKIKLCSENSLTFLAAKWTWLLNTSPFIFEIICTWRSSLPNNHTSTNSLWTHIFGNFGTLTQLTFYKSWQVILGCLYDNWPRAWRKMAVFRQNWPYLGYFLIFLAP